MATAYAQAGSKRQKVRDGRVNDANDYFQGIDKLEYCGPTGDSFYRYYNSSDRVLGRAVDDWLKIGVSISSVKYDGADEQGRATFTRSWDDKTSPDHHKRCLKATFDLCNTLSVKHWCGFDNDIVPEEKNLEEVAGVVEMAGRVLSPLWVAPDLHSHPRYSTGAFTNNEALTYAKAAAQIKRSLDICQRINSENFLLQPYRDGYDSLFKTDVSKELKLFAKLLKITVDYKERTNYRGNLLINPYGEDRKSDGRYIWDVMSCLYFLRHYGLERSYKVVAKPGRQMYMASAYNMLGGVIITEDCDPYDNQLWALTMRSIIKQGTPLAGGITLSVSPRRNITEGSPRALMTCVARYVDALARGLRTAYRLEQDQTIGKYIQQKYASYYNGAGARMANGEMTLEEIEEYDKKSHPQHTEPSCRPDLIEVVLQRHLDHTELM